MYEVAIKNLFSLAAKEGCDVELIYEADHDAYYSCIIVPVECMQNVFESDYVETIDEAITQATNFLTSLNK